MSDKATPTATSNAIPSVRGKVKYRGEDGEIWRGEVVNVIDADTVDLALHVESGDGQWHIHGGAPGAKRATSDADKKTPGRWWQG